MRICACVYNMYKFVCGRKMSLNTEFCCLSCVFACSGKLLFVILDASYTLNLRWSCSVVLVNFSEEGEGPAKVQVVMGHVVKEVEILQEADQETTRRLQTCFMPPSVMAVSQTDPEELTRRRDAVRQWLEKNRVPVQEEGAELRVAGVLTITAPYRPSDCISSNQIILDRIQKLVCALKPD